MVWDSEEQDRLEELEPLYYDVPAHLRRELWLWVNAVIRPGQGRSGIPAIELLLNALRIAPPTPSYSALLNWFEQYCQSPANLLNTIRAILKHMPDEGRAQTLERCLTRGHSGYAVRLDNRGLEFRVAPPAREQVERVIADSEEGVSQRLVKAWNGAYGMESSAEHSYDMSIKAVEAAYRPIISPEGKSQLGAMIATFEAAPHKWEFELSDHRPPGRPDRPEFDDVQTVLAMLKMLSFGQRARHPMDGSVGGNSVDEARAAVHLAVTLVQWVNSGAFRRR